MRRLVLLLCTSGCLLPGPSEGIGRGEVLFSNYCAPCHSADGTGKAHLGAPAIAGLADWYVEGQVEKFRGGIRGAHPDDDEGMRMRPMARIIRDDSDLTVVSEYVASLPRSKRPVTLEGGDPEKGAGYYATCAACHGQDAGGQEALKAPDLANADDWYLYRQLHKFKSGIRGTNPADATGAQMVGMVNVLPDDQAMKDVIAYIQTLSPTTTD